MRFATVCAWSQCHPKWAEFLFACAFGLLLEVILLFQHQPPIAAVRWSGDKIADAMIRLAERTANSLSSSPAFVFINIDDKTWREWGSPLITPRARLAELIDCVARSGPLAIVVDVDLAFSEHDTANGAESDTRNIEASSCVGRREREASGQRALNATLKDYETGFPPLLLVRNLINHPFAEPERLPDVRPTAYEAAVARHENIAWTTPLFEKDSDGNVRRWRLVELACSGKEPVVIPSVHLAAAMIAREALNGPHRGVTEGPPLKRLQNVLTEHFHPEGCTRVHTSAHDDGEPLELGSAFSGAPVTIDEEQVSKRVIYRVGWQHDAVALGPLVESSATSRVQLVAIRPADTVLSGEADEPIPGIQGRIAVIGGSFSDSGDWHQTPLGRMPGALLIINAAHALAHSGTPHEPLPVARMLISAGFVVVIAGLVVLFRPAIALMLALFLIFLVMILTLHWFKSGVVIDLAIPSVGAFVHTLWTTAQTAYEALRSEGWRSLLRRYEHAHTSGAP